MADFGPISLVAVGFLEPEKLKGALLEELFTLSEAGIIRVIGLLGIVKDPNGTIGSVQMTQLPDADRVKLAAGVGALIGFGATGEQGAHAGAEMGAQIAAQKEYGLSQDQIREIAEGIPRGTAAGFVLLEHLYAKRLKDLAQQQHGVLLANAFINPQALVGLGAALAEGAMVAEQARLA
ncbi:MAG: DUF1269 domain-containing protein [Methanospirillum sp.]|nr:DUF1269 domain-containing protein [Methanospirillum sp.]